MKKSFVLAGIVMILIFIFFKFTSIGLTIHARVLSFDVMGISYYLFNFLFWITCIVGLAFLIIGFILKKK